MNLTVSDMYRSLGQAIALTLVVAMALLGTYLYVEPTVGHSQAFDQFEISQTVTAEISFIVATNDCTMDSSIPGIAGGTANCSSQVRVLTNNTAGYNMTIQASGSPAMQGESQGGSIRDFSTTTLGSGQDHMTEPSFQFTGAQVPSNDAGFGYTVAASSSGEIDASFQDNGSICNTGSNETADRCYIGASTTAFQIINTTAETLASGSTSTISFRTVINSSPAPAIPEDSYTATATLTATVN